MTPTFSSSPSRSKSAVRVASHAAIAVAIGIALGGCPPPKPAPPNPNLLCFPTVSGVPNFGGSPSIDGWLSGPKPSTTVQEFGWTGSMRYTFGNGTTTPPVAVQGIKDSSNLYLSFEVNFASTPDVKDGILLVFSPTKNQPTNDRRIFIAPFNGVPPTDTSVTPAAINYWVDSTNDNWNDVNQNAHQAANNPAFLVNNTKAWHTSSNTYYVEMEIPINNTATNGVGNQANDTGINFPASGDFGFYFDVLDHNGGYVEHTFPLNTGLTPSQGIAAPDTNTPSAAAWGRGSLGGIQCNGVSFDAYRDAKILHPDSVSMVGDATISLNQRNQFTVTVWNDSVDGNNNYIQALDVDARFRIADFGIAGLGDYADIPNGTHDCSGAGGSATEPASHTCVNMTVPVPPNNTISGQATLQAPDWTLTAQQQTDYNTPERLHQCILVELDSNASNPPTILLNKSAVRNMDFAQTSSPFRQTVSIGAGRERREDTDMLIITRSSNTPDDAKWSFNLEGAQPVPGRPGLFTLRVKAGAASKVPGITEPPPVAIPSRDIRIPPNTGADGKGVSIPVKPGDILTLIADGSIQVRRDKQLRAGPDGALVDARSDGQYLLASNYGPGRRVGAIVAAWNGDFKGSAMILGSAATVKAPARAESLVIALNDTPAGFAEHSGDGFHVQVIQTPMQPYFGVTNTNVRREASAERLRLPIGANLPTTAVCGYRKTGRKINVNGLVDDLLEEVGCYGYMFNQIVLH